MHIVVELRQPPRLNGASSRDGLLTRSSRKTEECRGDLTVRVCLVSVSTPCHAVPDGATGMYEGVHRPPHDGLPAARGSAGHPRQLATTRAAKMMALPAARGGRGSGSAARRRWLCGGTDAESVLGDIGRARGQWARGEARPSLRVHRARSRGAPAGAFRSTTLGGRALRRAFQARRTPPRSRARGRTWTCSSSGFDGPRAGGPPAARPAPATTLYMDIIVMSV
eukprot:scaffold516_cov401-Prasinococcus_capsulatus_cf.AAC.17